MHVLETESVWDLYWDQLGFATPRQLKFPPHGAASESVLLAALSSEVLFTCYSNDSAPNVHCITL
jgi:hypothetical protein